MSREIIISESDNIVAIIENKHIVEFIIPEGDQAVGDIILGRVESIVPGIEAAFINIGRTRHGFIHVADLPSSRGRQSGIKQYLRPKQPLIVQIIKSPTLNKGARLSGMVAIPGRYLVLTPFERRIGISRSIEEPGEKSRLSRIVNGISQPGYGLIVRTEAIGQSEVDLKHDLDELIATWQQILFQSEKVQPPAVLYRDQDLMQRVVREAVTHDTLRIIIDREEGRRRMVDLLKKWSVDAEVIRNVQVYRGRRPLLVQYNLLQELEAAVQPKAPLPSGGSLVIEPTEALTVIDVNSGRMTSAEGMNETILETNREAAVEVARQLRLRDIGGVIVVDFITMTDPRHQQIIWQTLHEAIKADKAKPQLGYFSEQGLLEVNRRRQRQSLREYLSVACPTCQGVGRIRNQLFRYDVLTAEVTDQRTSLSAILKEAEPLAPGVMADEGAGEAPVIEQDEEGEEPGRGERTAEPRARGRERDRGRRGERFDRDRDRSRRGGRRDEYAVHGGDATVEPGLPPPDMPVEEMAEEPELVGAPHDDMQMEPQPAASPRGRAAREEGEDSLPEAVQQELAEIAMELAEPREEEEEETPPRVLSRATHYHEEQVEAEHDHVHDDDEEPTAPEYDTDVVEPHRPEPAVPELAVDEDEEEAPREDENAILIEPSDEIAPPPVVITTRRRAATPRGRRPARPAAGGTAKGAAAPEGPRRRTTRTTISE